MGTRFEMPDLDPHVRRASPEDWAACVRIVRELPEFFEEDVPERVRSDLRLHDAWILVDGNGTVAGFLVATRRFPHAAEILWIAIDRTRRRLGLGTQLLEAALHDLRLEGVAVVEVKTLDSSADYPPYDETRQFYEHRGFVHIDTIEALPGWGADNPAAFYVAALGITTSEE